MLGRHSSLRQTNGNNPRPAAWQRLACPANMRMIVWLFLLPGICFAAQTIAEQADNLTALVQDPAAIERVYYNHRLGQKPPFEQATPPALIERLVREDLRKEAALRQVYGVVITPALLEAELQRINTTTRAPDRLAEINAALGNDPAKFAQAFAKPATSPR